MAIEWRRGEGHNVNPVATPFFFYLLSTLAILTALGVVAARNPVHSALSLVFTLLSLAGLYLMLYAPFVAGVQIILYVGGIMVLFLFVIMLVNIEQAEQERRYNSQRHVAIIAALVLGAMFIYIYSHASSLAILPQGGRLVFHPEQAGTMESNNTQAIGIMLYGQYMLPFEIASLLLLVAIVGAVVMSKKRI